MLSFSCRVPRFHAMPKYTVQLGNGGLGSILGWRVLDADTGKEGPLLHRHEADAVARLRNARGW